MKGDIREDGKMRMEWGRGGRDSMQKVIKVGVLPKRNHMNVTGWDDGYEGNEVTSLLHDNNIQHFNSYYVQKNKIVSTQW